MGFNEAGEDEALSSSRLDIVTCHISPHTWQESHQSRWSASFFSSAMRVSPQRGQAGDFRNWRTGMVIGGTIEDSVRV